MLSPGIPRLIVPNFVTGIRFNKSALYVKRILRPGNSANAQRSIKSWSLAAGSGPHRYTNGITAPTCDTSRCHRSSSSSWFYPAYWDSSQIIVSHLSLATWRPAVRMDDSDEDLKRAIALSLGSEAVQSPRANEPILIEDSDDEDMKRAIALSLQAHEPVGDSTEPIDLVEEQSPKRVHQECATPIDNDIPVTGCGPTGLMGLDRRAMEQERLARLAARTTKRAREISPPALSRPAKVTRVSSTSGHVSTPPGSSRQRNISPAQQTQAVLGQSAANPKATGADTITASSESMHHPVSDGRISYPEGRLFKTWAFGHARTGAEIKIEEVLERRTLKTALLSSYQFDFEWLFTKIDTQRTNFQFVCSEKRVERRVELQGELESLGPNVKVCLPALEGGAYCMHSKLMLLFHPDKLRVAIPSANLVPYDWGESGIMENTVWIIDLPRLQEGHAYKPAPFAEELKYFLKKQGLAPAILNGLDNFDWACTTPYAFIHSIPQPTFGLDLPRTGLTGLSTAVRRLGLSSTDTQIDMAASSIGSLTTKQLSLLAAAAAGSLTTFPQPDGSVTTVPSIPDLDLDRFRIYYPSLSYVQSSTGGTPSGGTIWLKRSAYTKATFPKVVFREFTSTRRGLLSHSKLIFVRGMAAASNENGRGEGRGQEVAFLYAGSANASEAAWGGLGVESKGTRRGEVRITARNWEAGVLIPVVTPGVEGGRRKGVKFEDERNDENGGGKAKGKGKANLEEKGTVPSFEVFRDVIDGPFVVPAPKLTGEPWYCEEHVYNRR
ncbi:phospholipase D/nuclease [Myriangium duriaei CBS 260.36]|uniref:Phospholipase D/nuclease n=1 Tax=Myriangium duriaei CBS 260.36 TaxID=1168546 RepID=A0A9P4IR03_9PEZI|nr:phospholipase D/nuclease [Myriangium duriaei CBS 260.36]